MYTAAASATGFDKQLVVRDLVELLADALALPNPEEELVPVPAGAGVPRGEMAS